MVTVKHALLSDFVGARQSHRPTITPKIASSLALLAMTVVKGIQRDFPLAGDWGCPPAILIPPLLEERGTGGEVNGNIDTPPRVEV